MSRTPPSVLAALCALSGLLLAFGASTATAQTDCPTGDCQPSDAAGYDQLVYAQGLDAGPVLAVYHDGPAGRGGGATCQWFQPYTERSNPDLFYNFYVPAGGGGEPAAAYPAPYPTPSLVGHTYYTYQPLMPHEFLYRHHRTYHQGYNGGMGLNRTKVVWYGTPVRTTLHGIRHFFYLPR